MHIYWVGLAGGVAGFITGILTIMLCGSIFISMINSGSVRNWKLQYVMQGFVAPLFLFGIGAILWTLTSDFSENGAAFDVSWCVVGIVTHTSAFWKKRELFKKLHEERLSKLGK